VSDLASVLVSVSGAFVCHQQHSGKPLMHSSQPVGLSLTVHVALRTPAIPILRILSTMGTCKAPSPMTGPGSTSGEGRCRRNRSRPSSSMSIYRNEIPKSNCMAFRHRHPSRRKLIETAEVLVGKGPWSRKGGCLFFVRRKAPWKKSGYEIERGSRDLLNTDPRTPPQELARATGRSVSWVKKWRKRL